MQCQSSECPSQATHLVAFPWAEPVAACKAHVELAQQLMVNLGRENELRLTPVPPGDDEAPITPRDLVTTAEPATPSTTPPRRLELELELERLRMARAELELKAATVFSDAVANLGKFAADFAEHIPAIVATVRETLARDEAEPGEVVEGPTAEPEADPQPLADQQPSPA